MKGNGLASAAAYNHAPQELLTQLRVDTRGNNQAVTPGENVGSTAVEPLLPPPERDRATRTATCAADLGRTLRR